MSLIAVKQLNQDQLTLFVQQASSGASFSGNFVNYVQNSGFMGPLVVWTTGNQSITGAKTFLVSPVVPYVGATNTAPSTLYVLDQDRALSGVLTGTLTQQVLTLSGALSSVFSTVQITGTNVSTANFTGLGGTLVFTSGGYTFISGGAGGGGSNVSVTGSAAVATPNFTGDGSVTVSYDGTYIHVSGAGVGSSYSGYAESTFVHLTGSETISGTKTFATTPLIPTGASAGPEAVNLTQLTATSGALTGSFAASLNSLSGVLTGQMADTSGVLYTAITGMTGYISNNYFTITGTGTTIIDQTASGVINNVYNVTGGDVVISGGTTIQTGTFNTIYGITGTGTVNISNVSSGDTFYNLTSGTFIVSGSTLVQTGNFIYNITGTGTVNISGSGVFNVTGGTVNSYTTNNYSFGTITGNFVNMSFYFDEYTLATGLNFVETIIGREFTFTGYALGAITSGTQGFFSGSFYQRTPTNAKTSFLNFSFNSGLYFASNGGYSQTISGLNRVGLDILRIGTGLTGVTVGLFGVGY